MTLNSLPENNKFKVLNQMIKIKLKRGKYKEARELLEKFESYNNPYLELEYGKLENIENNFSESLKHYDKSMKFPNTQFFALQGYAKIYSQKGEYKLVEKIYETLLMNKTFTIQAKIGLISLHILNQNYDYAWAILSTINPKNLTPKLKQHYDIIYYYLKYLMGNLKSEENIYNPQKGYMIYRLFNLNDNLLIEHINKHKNQDEREINGCFFKYLDTKALLKDAQKIIAEINPNHFEITDMYRFRLDTPIGYKGNSLTNDLCVVTMIGTKDIITMYPVSLSPLFDKEGFSQSKKVKTKRLERNI